MMALRISKRVVLRFDEKYELDWDAIIQTYMATLGSDPDSDFYPHLMAPNMSTKMHIILDLHCERVPSVDVSAMEHEVFKVKKAGEHGKILTNRRNKCNCLSDGQAMT